ncbi:MAG: A/G-specific adenine glycosylase [Planctomycetota bacterium]
MAPAPEHAAEDRARREALLAWFAAHQRDLPWRRSRDAYRVWISEAMLQQTRVEAVVPYFERFLARFPTLADLAAASEDDVVAAWSGLGYYRRARALREAAREVVAHHGGRFPADRKDALALPGVGPYTAGAVLSIAYDLRVPLVDGNVTRVLARWFGLSQPVGTSALTSELWRLAERLLPPEGATEARGPGAWNQALMELGATVCTPRSPRCEACPVAEPCAARASGRVDELPVPAPRRAPVDVRLGVALAVRGERILVERRPARGRMAGMWELPTRELPGPEGGLTGLWPPEFAGPALREGEPLGEVSHGITHHRIRARVRAAWAEGEGGADGAPERRWVSPEAASELGLTGMARKILARPFVFEHLGSLGSRP